MKVMSTLLGSLVLGAGLAGCGETIQFKTVDATTGEPVPQVSVQRKHTKHFGALRLEGETTVETLGSTNSEGRASVTGVTGDDAILFDREGYWPAVFNADFPIDHIISHPRDEEAKKTGLIGPDAIFAVKSRIHKQLGINEGGKPARRTGGVIIVPLHSISQ